jgi:small-conductance mechanosensitive channel
MFSPATKALVVTLLAVGAALVLTTLISYSIIPQVEPQILSSVFAVLAGVVAYYVLSALASRIEEPKLRFTFEKIVLVVATAIVLIGLLAVWIQQLTFLAISLGLVAAGVSFSLQQPITSMVGWLVLAFERPFSVGDRIEINGVAGDVIDYGFFFVRVMEIREWTDADLYTGRILLVPTNWILSNTVYNYSKDFGYIWDKLWIGLLYGVDYTKVANDIREMASQHLQTLTEEAMKAYTKIEKKYFLKDTAFEPQVFVSFNSNWVQLDLRYVTGIKVRTKTRSELSAIILQYLSKNGITVASSSMNVNVAEEKS